MSDTDVPLRVDHVEANEHDAERAEHAVVRKSMSRDERARHSDDYDKTDGRKVRFEHPKLS
jgi:hypothetical protein